MVIPDASVEALSFSEGDESNVNPSPELGGRTVLELRWLGEPFVVREGRSRGEQRKLDLDLAALMIEEALVIEEIQEGLPVSDMHECLPGTDGQYNPQLLGTVKDTKDLAARWCELEARCALEPTA